MTQNPLLPAGFPSKDTPVTIESLSATYQQEEDSSSTDGHQFLKISTSDGGGGIYFVIKTERWAFDNIEDLIILLTDFKRRLSHSR